MAIKILISGYENTGKSTIAGNIKDALVINCDMKEYTFKVPHCNIDKWTSLKEFTKVVNEKIKTYKEKFGKLPTFIVFDTITQLYMKMTKFNNTAYKNFEIHRANDTDTLGINTYIEDVLIRSGINVILVAHTMIEENQKHSIPAVGAFKRAGSWLSVVNEAIYIHRKGDEHKIFIRDNEYPCRTLIDREYSSISVSDFDINKYLSEIINHKAEVEEFKL